MALGDNSFVQATSLQTESVFNIQRHRCGPEIRGAVFMSEKVVGMDLWGMWNTLFHLSLYIFIYIYIFVFVVVVCFSHPNHTLSLLLSQTINLAVRPIINLRVPFPFPPRHLLTSDETPFLCFFHCNTFFFAVGWLSKTLNL